MAMILEAVGLALATLVSEDLACVSAGLLVQRGEISLLTAVAGCAVGIFAGDCGLWAIGRGADRIATYWPSVAGLRTSALVRTMSQEVAANAAWSILGSRFLPGARVPLYIAAGALGLPGVRFAKWALLATLLWTPSVILATANLGDVAERTHALRGWGAAIVAVGLFVGMRSMHFARTRSGFGLALRLTSHVWSRLAATALACEAFHPISRTTARIYWTIALGLPAASWQDHGLWWSGRPDIVTRWPE